MFPSSVADISSVQTLRAELITDLGAVASIEDRWRELAVRRSNGFITPEWFHAWWEAQGSASCTPLISVARRPDGEVAGVMPLVLDKSSRPRAIRFGGASIGDRFHPVAAANEEEAVAVATMVAIEEAHQIRPMILLEHFESDRGWWGQMESAGKLERIAVAQPATVAPFIDLRGLDWEAYLATRSKNFRKQARRAERSLVRDHGMTVRWSTEETLEADLVELFRLHDLRLSGLGGSSLRPASRRALGKFAAAAQRRGWLRLSVMEAEGSPVAAFLGWRVGDSFASYQGGFDPAWSKLGVGFALETMMVRKAVEEGAAEYDFLLGTEAWKHRFTDRGRTTQTAVVVRAHRPVRVLVTVENQVRQLTAGLENRHRLRAIARSMHGLIPTARAS